MGDPVATGMAAAEMEPELEILFSKMQSEVDAAKKLEEQLEEAESYADQADELMDSAQKAADEGDDKGAQNYQDQAEKIQEALEKLLQQIAEGQEELSEELDDKTEMIKKSLKESLEEVNAGAEALADFDSWGLSAGTKGRLDPTGRMQLAKKLRTEKFRKMSEIIGRMQNVAFSEQVNTIDHANEEVYGLERGADLARVVPSELLALADDDLAWDMLRRYTERSLVQYALQGTETVTKGGIVALLDSSGSMSGERRIWSKAIALALLKIAKAQKRPFTAIEFSSPGQYIHYDFDTTGHDLELTEIYGNSKKHTSGAEAVLAFAEGCLDGGTCFTTAFSKALDLMREEHQQTGNVDGDIVFLTDGQCGMDPRFIESFKAEQERLKFKVFGIAVQTSPDTEPMQTMCDGNVIDLKMLTDVNDMRPLFGSVIS